MQKIKSLLNKVVKDGFTEQENNSIYGYLRLIVFIIGAIPLGYFFVLYRKHYISSLDDILYIYMKNGTFAEFMLGFFGIFLSPVMVILVSFYWFFSFLNFLYKIIVLPIKTNFIEPTKNNIKSFTKDIKNNFSNSQVWHLHMRWYRLFKKLGLQLGLFPFLSHLEPELENKESIQNFQIDSLILPPPYDTPEFINRVRNRYKRLDSIVLPVWGFVSLLIFFATVVIFYFIVGLLALRFVSILFVIAVFWCELLWGIALFGFMNPIRIRSATWYKEYKLAKDREYREWTIQQLEQELLQPDSRIERLKELSELQSQELKELANRSIENENDKIKFSELLKNQQDTFDKLFQRHNESLARQNETLEKSKKPAAIVEGISLNIVASIFFVILSSIVSYIFGLLSKKP